MKYLFVFALLVFFSSAHSQTPHLHCGTDEIHRNLRQHEALNRAIMTRERTLNEFTKNFDVAAHSRQNDPYIIPVVFHIIHNFGPENISDLQVYDAVEQVNLQLRKFNADTTEIVNEFADIAVDTQIEIRLAQKDPDGNCTNGITRTVSSLTNPGDHAVKSLIQWPPDQYLNIYVCADAAGLAGHAVMPAAADTIPEWDGIVMRHDYVGSIGTSNDFRRTVVTHEIGHYLNLQHIWGGNNVPDFFYLPVGQSENCSFDDGVDDTPLTIGWSACNTSSTSCGSLDNVQNYMDYAYCARMFTEGQRDRMHAALNSPIAGRNNLWQSENLETTGVLDEPILCAVQFGADAQLVCAGTTVQFNDLSYNAAESWEWTFEGGEPAFSTEQNPAATYNVPGIYDVILQTTAGGETLQQTEQAFIQVFSEPENQATALVEHFEDTAWSQLNWSFYPEDPYGWKIADVGYESDWSLVFENEPTADGRIVQAISEPLNLSGAESGYVAFRWASAKRNPDDNDLLRVFVSTNCGQTWVPRTSLNGIGLLPTVDAVPEGAFLPTSPEQWEYRNVSLLPGHLTESLLIKIEFTSDGGNYIYIDDFIVGEDPTLSIEDNPLNEALRVFPVPFGDELNVEWSDATNPIQTVRLLDIHGRVLIEQQPMRSRFTINTSALPRGSYLLQVQTEKGLVTRKVIR